VSELVARFEKRFSDRVRVSAELIVPAYGRSVTVLFGPSGSGKTTILRCLAGLDRPDSGTIAFAGELWLDTAAGIDLSPAHRRLGFLSQDYSLFPHLTVESNVGYGLSRMPRAQRLARVRAMLDRFELSPVARQYPDRISGGEQQRVALARALVTEPRMLLLDEPLSALDAPLREKLRPELKRLLSAPEFSAPVLLVTHDRLDAITLADRMVVVDAGRILQTGAVDEVFSRPRDARVAEIVGVEVILEGRVLSAENGLASVSVAGVELTALSPAGGPRDVLVCIRAEGVILERGTGGPSSVRNRLTGRVELLEDTGATVRVVLDVGFRLIALVTRAACDELGLAPGERVSALVKAPAVHLVERTPG